VQTGCFAKYLLCLAEIGLRQFGARGKTQQICVLRKFLQCLFANSCGITRIAGPQTGERVVEVILLLLCGNDQMDLKVSVSESSTQHSADCQPPLW
jgi:hypothetical protein